MVTMSPLTQIQKQYDQSLTWLNQLIWPSEQEIDPCTKAFYVFKAYPKELKNNQMQAWAKLQRHSLSPFVAGEVYQYLSKAGLHLWISQGKFSGIPETAIQTVLPDGNYTLAGSTHLYQQSWQNGLLVSCFTIENKSAEGTEPTLPLKIEKRSPWGVPRKIDEKLKLPSTWLGLTLFLSLCVSFWFGTAYLTATIQQSSAETHISQLESSLGEKLAMQNQLQNKQQGLSLLQNWQQEFAFLPETFAQVAKKLSLEGTWKANSVSWQNRTISIELMAEDLDIAKLVNNLESLEDLSKINIRPHASENTWILEASVK